MRRWPRVYIAAPRAGYGGALSPSPWKARIHADRESPANGYASSERIRVWSGPEKDFIAPTRHAHGRAQLPPWANDATRERTLPCVSTRHRSRFRRCCFSQWPEPAPDNPPRANTAPSTVPARRPRQGTGWHGLTLRKPPLVGVTDGRVTRVRFNLVPTDPPRSRAGRESESPSERTRQFRSTRTCSSSDSHAAEAESALTTS